MDEQVLESISRRLEECGGLFTWCLPVPRWYRLLTPPLKVGENGVMEYKDKMGTVESMATSIALDPRAIVRETPAGFEVDYAAFKTKLPPFGVVDRYSYGLVDNRS